MPAWLAISSQEPNVSVTFDEGAMPGWTVDAPRGTVKDPKVAVSFEGKHDEKEVSPL
jgi:hypothetical protein